MTNFWIETYAGVMLASLILSGIIIPQILHVAFRRKLFDVQDERKLHKGAVPRLGGFSFMPSIMFALCLVCGVCMLGHVDLMTSAFNGRVIGVLFLICGLMLIFLVGMADDLIGVRYSAKFVAQIVVAVFLICGGAVFTDFEGLFGLWKVPGVIGWLFSILIIVYIVNALNLIDGIDGLASGLSMIAMVCYGVMLHMAGLHILALLAWATLGTLMPFFYYNYFGDTVRHKKIFMGDTGSLTIGTMISFLALTMTNVAEFKETDLNPVICAFAPIIVPAFDVLRVYYHRVRHGRNPFLPDRCHIHHKLLALGVSTRKALALILITAVIFLVSNILLSRHMNPTLLVLADIVAWTGGNIILTKMIRRREARLGQELYV